MPNLEIVLAAEMQIVALGDILENSADGEYKIESVRIGGTSSKDSVLNYLMFRLSREFPGFYWWRSESLFDPDGITVHWRRKDRTLEK